MTSEQMDVLEMLVEAGADIDIKDKEVRLYTLVWWISKKYNPSMEVYWLFLFD